MRDCRTDTQWTQGYAVLSDAGEFITAASIETVLGNDEETAGFEIEAYQSILDYLDETMFTSYDRQRMIAASHEIEDRAWRIGSGSVHAGFQMLSTLEPQIDTYEQLADRNSLSVRVYAAPEGEIPDHETVSFISNAPRSENRAHSTGSRRTIPTPSIGSSIISSRTTPSRSPIPISTHSRWTVGDFQLSAIFNHTRAPSQ